MAGLVRKIKQGNFQCRRQGARHTRPHREAWHIRARLIPWAGRNAHGSNAAVRLLQQGLHQLRQLLNMMKNRIALAQAERSFPYRQQLLSLQNSLFTV